MSDRVYVEVGDELLPVHEVNEQDFDACEPQSMLGIPAVWCMTKMRGRLLWPRPIKACKMWQLEPLAYAERDDVGN